MKEKKVSILDRMQGIQRLLKNALGVRRDSCTVVLPFDLLFSKY